MLYNTLRIAGQLWALKGGWAVSCMTLEFRPRPSPRSPRAGRPARASQTGGLGRVCWSPPTPALPALSQTVGSANPTALLTSSPAVLLPLPVPLALVCHLACCPTDSPLRTRACLTRVHSALRSGRGGSVGRRGSQAWPQRRAPELLPHRRGPVSSGVTYKA